MATTKRKPMKPKPKTTRKAVKVSESRQTSGTRHRLIDTAMQLFYDNGYEATGIAEILKQSKVNSGSLYYYFKTKEELLLAVLEKHKELLWPIVIQPVFDQTEDPLDRIWGILEGYRQMLLTTAFTAGCPIGNLALEMAVKSEPVRRGIEENFEGWRIAVRSLLAEAQDRLEPELDHDKMATLILTTMEGGVMQARAYKNIAPFDDSVRMLRFLIEHSMGKADR